MEQRKSIKQRVVFLKALKANNTACSHIYCYVTVFMEHFHYMSYFSLKSDFWGTLSVLFYCLNWHTFQAVQPSNTCDNMLFGRLTSKQKFVMVVT